LTGVKVDSSIEIVNDRQGAITKAITECNKGDVVLIAGKGHESYQMIGKDKHPFDEVAIIRKADHA